MTVVRTREAAARWAEAQTRFATGMCQVFTRTAFGLQTGVGDVDGDGDADAVDGWLSEPAHARHTDRNPPRGVPVAFSGGSKGYGHRAVSVGGGRVRSTDMGSLGKYAPGLVSTVSIAQVEAALGVRYTGWTDTISGQPIPRDPAPDPKPPKVRPLYLATFNSHNRLAALRSFFEDLRKKVGSGELPGMPDRITLCEAHTLYQELPALAGRYGYDVHQERPLPDAPIKPSHGSTATLTRRSTFKVRSKRVDAMKLTWLVYTANRTHKPRRFVRIVGSVAEAGVRRGVFVSAHGPTNGLDGVNRAPFAEAVAAWRRTLLVTRPGSVAVVDGDLNDQAGDLRKWATGVLPSLLAVTVDGHSVDVLLTRAASIRTHVLGSYGSDHKAVFWVVTPRPALREQIARARKLALRPKPRKR